MPTRTRTVAWVGLDDPRRKEVCRIRFDEESLEAFGTSVTPDYALTWQLETGEQWVTRTLLVQVNGGTWERRLRLTRGADGGWESEANAVGKVDLPEPGLADPDAVAGALDCDLGLCPMTNTMPILRLGLLSSTPPPPTELLMAWVEVPTLRVLPSEQTYSPVSRNDDGSGIVEYAGKHRDFVGELEVDADGLVVTYPELARSLR